MKKQKTNAVDSAFKDKTEIMMMKWNANSIETMASNNGNIQPLSNAKRYHRTQK